MAFSVSKEERGMYFLIRITGEFSFRSLSQIRETFESAMEIGHLYVAFDITKATVIDSGGIGLLANINQKLVTRGGSAYLIGIPEDLRPSLETSGILQAIPYMETLEQADQQIG